MFASCLEIISIIFFQQDKKGMQKRIQREIPGTMATEHYQKEKRKLEIHLKYSFPSC
jgi:hypothetical protein